MFDTLNRILELLPWNKIAAYASAFITIVGLASFAEDLRAWQDFFSILYSSIKPIYFFGYIGSSFAIGLHAVVDLYRAVFYPIFDVTIKPIIDLIGNFFNFKWDSRVYDIIFIGSSSFSRWVRGQYVRKRNIREAAAQVPPKPEFPQLEKLTYDGVFGWLASLWDRLDGGDYVDRKKQEDSYKRDRNRQEIHEYLGALKVYQTRVADIEMVARAGDVNALNSALLIFSILFVIWIVDIAYVKFYI